jgi:hypothetical protein
MIITGTITLVGQASEPSGQYNVRYQEITIVDQAGKSWYGRIGSKQGYQVNTPISVTVEVKPGEQGEYNYFRKYNPQYGGQSTSQRSPQAPSRAAQQPKPAEGIAVAEIRLVLVGAAIQSGQFKVKSNMDIEYWKNYVMTGRAPLPPSKIPDPHPDITEQQDRTEERAREETDTPF